MTCNRLLNFAFKSAKAEPGDSISLSKAYLSKAERPMRVAVFVVFVSILATASEASQSCMTRTEARGHYGSTHLYWHGAGHCWVDIVQVAAPSVIKGESEPMITPQSVAMVITVLTLTLAIVEFLIIGMRLAGPPR